MKPPPTPLDRTDLSDAATIERLRAATATLEAIMADRAMLAMLSDEERQRLIQAAAAVYCPDVQERRRLVKAMIRQRTVERQQRERTVRAETGIRKLREQPVFTTPNLAPPPDAEPVELPEGEEQSQLKPLNCYVCKRDYTQLHHFYDQLCPPCAELNFRKRSELADQIGRAHV